MQFQGIAIKGLTEKEAGSVASKVNAGVLNTLINQVPSISLHAHFYILFEYGLAHIDHNRRAVIVEYRVGELTSTEADTEGISALDERLATGIEKILTDNNILGSVVVRAIM